MPIQTFHDDFLGFKIEACDVDRGTRYVMRFDGCKWEFVPYGDVAGEQTLLWDCTTGDLSITENGPLSPIVSTVNISLLVSDPALIAIITNPANWNNGSYIGPATPAACIGNFFYDDATGTRYQYNGTTWYQFDTLPLDLMTEILYADLMTLQSTGILIPGMMYKITDFQNISPIGNTSGEYTTGPVEKLIVTAISTTQISNIAISEDYPKDIISYDPDDNFINNYGESWIEFGDTGTDFVGFTITGTNTFQIELSGPFVMDGGFYIEVEDDNGVYAFGEEADEGTVFSYVDLGSNVYEFTLIGYTGDIGNIFAGPNESGYFYFGASRTAINRPGIITYRKNLDQDIETNYDFRTVKSRFRDIDTSTLAWNVGTSYNIGDFALYNNTIYQSIRPSTGQTPSTTSGYWVPVLYYYAGGPASYTSGSVPVGGYYLSSAATYQDIPVFSKSDFTYDDSRVFGYKNIIDGFDYPVALGNSSTYGPIIENVNLGKTESTIFFKTDGVRSVDILAGYDNILSGNHNNVKIGDITRSMMFTMNDYNVSKVYQSSLYQSSKIVGGKCNQLLVANIQNFDFLDLYRFKIGNKGTYSKNFSIQYGNNCTLLLALDSTVTGNFYNNTIGRLEKATVTGQFYQNTCGYDSRLRGKYNSWSANNTINGTISGEFTSMSSNWLNSNISDVIVTSSMSSNYIDNDQFNTCRFTVFNNNGTSQISPYAGNIQALNIVTFNSNVSDGGTVYGCTGNEFSGNDFGGVGCRVFDCQFVKLQSLSYTGVYELEMNNITEVAGLTVGGNVKYNTGNYLQAVTVGNFYRNTFDRVQGINLSAATIVSNNSYSKQIFENNNGNYSVTWFNSGTGLNFADATT